MRAVLAGWQATHMRTRSALKYLSTEMGWTCSKMWIKSYRKWEKGWKDQVQMDMASVPLKGRKWDPAVGDHPYSNPDEREGFLSKPWR